MKIYLVIAETEQSRYTEGRYWSQADDSRKILHAFYDIKKARAKADELQAQFDDEYDEENEDEDFTRYYCQPIEVEE